MPLFSHTIPTGKRYTAGTKEKDENHVYDEEKIAPVKEMGMDRLYSICLTWQTKIFTI